MDDRPAGANDPTRSLVFLLRTARELLGSDGEVLAPWESRLRALDAPESQRLRVAVAGTVKSGKSTLVNALVGQDVLKRGAGIVTSLVTRVRPGDILRARLQLKGWAEVNREATDAALFLEAGAGTRPVDLRAERDRTALGRALDELGEQSFGEGGFFDKNVALLRAYLDGYERVADLVGEGARTVEFDPGEFERHRDFAGDDALAVYVDDLVLEIPELPFPGPCEVGDCQGYDSPNPRHMEKVQEYLLGAHLVVYVVSSRVGLREADLRFLRTIRALGLVGATRFVLNADLGEHPSADDLEAVRARVAAELRAVAGDVPVYCFSALRALLETLRRTGEPLPRREELLLALWEEVAATDGFEEFVAFLGDELGARREARLARAREQVGREATRTLRARLETALALTGESSAALHAQEGELRRAGERVQRSLEALEGALQGVGERLRRDLFRQVDAAFHPAGGAVAEDVLARARSLEAPPAALELADRKKLLRHMARVYQEMRAAFQRYQVEEVNPQAVDRIRELWGEASRHLAEAAAAPTELLVQSVEGYRAEARALGIDLPPLETPPLDPAIGRRTIPLFSAVAVGAEAAGGTERVLSFAGRWTRQLATGWTRRLTGRQERTGFVRSLLTDGAEAVRTLLAEEARSKLLQYNEQVKYQVLGKGLEELVEAWIRAYREMVGALVLDLERVAERLGREEADREDLIPRLRGILDALPPV